MVSFYFNFRKAGTKASLIDAAILAGLQVPDITITRQELNDSLLNQIENSQNGPIFYSLNQHLQL
jgi:hypothetical protein